LETLLVRVDGAFDGAIDSLSGEAYEGDARAEGLVAGWRALREGRRRGNEKFTSGDIVGAKAAYDEGLRAGGEDTPGASLLFCNRAACESASGAHEAALRSAEKAIERCDTYTKAKLRRANALVALMRFEDADKAFTELHDTLPGDVSIAASLNSCRSALKKPTVKAGVREIGDLEAYRAAIAKANVAVVDFTATWCGPCKMISPVFTSLASKHTNVMFLKVDVDQAQDVAAHERVNSMPTFAVYLQGQKVETFSGADGNKLSQLCAKYAAMI
jgi:thioredoxin